MEWTEEQTQNIADCSNCGRIQVRVRMEPYSGDYMCKPCWESVVYGDDE